MQEDVYPKGPSVQFYKMFTDAGVAASLKEYDALAIIEWDVLVASDRSFSELYRAAFSNAEDFWVKGSNLEGTNFHTAMAESSDMWHVMGHINGNAIYNNSDPMFREFVEYTLARWGYRYPYDVALWATIADFPYSWPLWQRFSSKFVTTNLVRRRVTLPAAAARGTSDCFDGTHAATLSALFRHFFSDPSMLSLSTAGYGANESKALAVHGWVGFGAARHAFFF